MSNSNLPTEFIKILKKEIPSNIYKNVINNLPREISKNKKLAKSIQKIEETFKQTENFKSESEPDSELESKSDSKNTDDSEEKKPTKKPRKKSPKIITVEAPITTDMLSKLPQPTPKSKLSFTSLYTPNENVHKPTIIPWDGKPPSPRDIPTTASNPLSVKMKIGDSTSGVSLDYVMGKPIVKTSVPKTDSLNRNTNEVKKPKSTKKTDEDKEAEIKKKAEEEVKAIKKAKEDAIKKQIDLEKAEAKGRAAGKAEAEKAMKDQKKEKKIKGDEIKEKGIGKSNKKIKKNKQIFNGKSLPAAIPVPVQVQSSPKKDSPKTDKLKDTSEIGSVISSILDKPLNTLSVGNVLQNMSGMASLLPSSIYSLTIQQLVNYSLKAFGDFFVDISQNITNLSIAKIYELLLKENRILYIGIGLFMITTIMYIFNNFIRIPFSLAGLLGVSGDKRVFINNY